MNSSTSTGYFSNLTNSIVRASLITLNPHLHPGIKSGLHP
jgi:hypothetical protein